MAVGFAVVAGAIAAVAPPPANEAADVVRLPEPVQDDERQALAA